MIEKNTVLLDLDDYLYLRKQAEQLRSFKDSIIYYDEKNKEMTPLQLNMIGGKPVAYGVSRKELEKMLDYEIPIEKMRIYG